MSTENRTHTRTHTPTDRHTLTEPQTYKHTRTDRHARTVGAHTHSVADALIQNFVSHHSFASYFNIYSLISTLHNCNQTMVLHLYVSNRLWRRGSLMELLL